jgi:hypothetical protein
MFKNTFQSGFLSVLYSIGSQPLQIWDRTVRCRGVALTLVPPPLATVSQTRTVKQVRNGHIKRITDPDIQSLVIEIAGTNVRYGRCRGELAMMALRLIFYFFVATARRLSRAPRTRKSRSASSCRFSS